MAFGFILETASEAETRWTSAAGLLLRWLSGKGTGSMEHITVRFWGVRGSVPSPGPATVRYGGNTPCVSVHLPGEKVVVFDAGTGIRTLGNLLAQNDNQIFVIVSHSHWDHIQGFPFFIPIYMPDRRISVMSFRVDSAMMHLLLRQMDGAHFPVTLDKLPSTVEIVDEQRLKLLLGDKFQLSPISANHPGGGFGYRIGDHERNVIYLTDNELDPPYPRSTNFDDFVRFCRAADVLIHDAQYIEEDLRLKRGWGHSAVGQACELAAAAGVRHLVLYHHDPERSDDDLDRIQEQARDWFRSRKLDIRCTAAFEGLALEI